MEIEGVKQRKKYYFIDESGDPNFYDRNGRLLTLSNGYQPYFIIGMVETNDRLNLRNAVVQYSTEIRNDILYNTIPSIRDNPEWFLHARNDHPEVRINFYEVLRRMDSFKTHVLIIRKSARIFENVHQKRSSSYYFAALRKLVLAQQFEEDVLHCLYLSKCGNNHIDHLNAAIAPLSTDNCEFKLDVVSSKVMPELSIVDYMLWAVQRKLLKGESRYFDALRRQYGTILEI